MVFYVPISCLEPLVLWSDRLQLCHLELATIFLSSSALKICHELEDRTGTASARVVYNRESRNLLSVYYLNVFVAIPFMSFCP